MNMAGLSFNTLPPIDLPFRFFITAPLFIIACGLLVFFSAEQLWLSRWHPHMLALTHGFTLGFLTMVMMGALLQLLPVIGGIGMPYPRRIASTSHASLSLGTLCLMLGFILNQPWLLIIAMAFLALGTGLYLCALAWVLQKKLSQGDSIIGFRFAVMALLLVLVLGIALMSRTLGINSSLATSYLPLIPSGEHVTNIHALWGLIGWAGLLIIAVSFQVIPMFHVAPSFPRIISRYLSASVFALLVLFIFLPSFALSILVISQGIFACSLLYTISKRKRKVADTSIRYWQLGAVSVLLINILYFIPDNLWYSYVAMNKEMLLAAIFIYFYLVSVIQGMLLKILPFLSYTHLQQACLVNFSAMQYIPHMHEFMNKKHGLWLFYLHLLTGTSLLLVLTQPSQYRWFAGMLMAEFFWLFFIMCKTMKLYFITQQKINLAHAKQ